MPTKKPYRQDNGSARQSYGEKLQDPRWQKRRLEIFTRDKWTCQGCESTEKTLHVHHRFYLKGREPWDHPDVALVTLCKGCHEQDPELKDREALLCTIADTPDTPYPFAFDSVMRLLRATRDVADPTLLSSIFFDLTRRYGADTLYDVLLLLMFDGANKACTDIVAAAKQSKSGARRLNGAR